MSLLVDKQTLDDLSIFAQRGKASVFQLFNNTATAGGSELLEEWFTYPLSDAAAIEKRAETIGYFIDHPTTFPFASIWFDQALFYLDMTDERSRLHGGNKSFKERIQSLLGADTEYRKIVSGISSCTQIIHRWKTLLADASTGADSRYTGQLAQFATTLGETALDALPLIDEKQRIKRADVIRYDNILRFEEKDVFRRLLRDIYMFDVYLTAAQAAREHGFTMPSVYQGEMEEVSFDHVFHPLIEGAKSNSILMDKTHNITFLTGANMAGKSTFMKSLGIALFLAHMGFPVPARQLVFSPRNGLYTSINLPDNIQMGYSHFYAEVLRVKKVAQQLAEGKKLFVIFDEMFRGTNVKDAYEGTVEIASRLYQHPRCQFVLSTHILEAGEQLRQSHPDIQYVFLPTVMKDGVPTYTYALQKGITEDRHGMVIIENEGIIDLLTLQNPTQI